MKEAKKIYSRFEPIINSTLKTQYRGRVNYLSLFFSKKKFLPYGYRVRPELLLYFNSIEYNAHERLQPLLLSCLLCVCVCSLCDDCFTLTDRMSINSVVFFFFPFCSFFSVNNCHTMSSCEPMLRARCWLEPRRTYLSWAARSARFELCLYALIGHCTLQCIRMHMGNVYRCVHVHVRRTCGARVPMIVDIPSERFSNYALLW